MKLGTQKTLVTALGIAFGAAWLGSAGMAGAQSTADKAGKPAEAASIQASAKVLAGRILSRWAPVAEAAGMDMALWQEQYSIQLNLMSEETLRIFNFVAPSTASTAAANYARFDQAFQDAAMKMYGQLGKKGTAKDLGSANDNFVFIPSPPCRVVDTRPAFGGSGPITAGTNKTFFAYNASASYSWSSQGGVAGTAITACPRTSLTSVGGTLGNVAPSAAVATVSVIAPTAAGNWVIWGGNGAAPGASALNWTAGQTLAATTLIPMGTRILFTNNDFRIQYNGPSGSADTTVDVVGYFVESAATALQCVNVNNLGTGTGNVPNSSHYLLTGDACTAGYTKVAQGCFYNGDLPLASALQEVSFTGNYCNWSILGAAVPLDGTDFRTEARCCRLPGQE